MIFGHREIRGLTCLVALGMLAAAGPAQADMSRLTVDEAVRLALRDNSTAYSAMKQVEQAEGAYKQTRSSILPQLSASGDLGHSFQGEQKSTTRLGGSVPSSRSNSHSGSLSLSQDLFNAQSWNLVRESNLSLDATRQGENNTRLVVALATRQQFYALVRAKQLAEVDAEAVRRDSSVLALTQGLFEVGSVPRTDLLKARTQAAQSTLALITGRHTVDIERLRLASLLGLQDDQGLDVEDKLADDIALPDSSNLLESALKNRPDLRQLESQIEASDAGVSAAKASRYPTIGANISLQKNFYSTTQDSFTSVNTASYLSGGNVNLQTGELNFRFRDTTVVSFSPERTYKSRPFSWQAGARLSLPLFDGLNAKGRIQQRTAEADIQRRNLRQKRTDVALEIRQAWLGLQEARQRTRVANDEIAYATESYELNKEKYRLGSSTLLDLTTAEAELTRSRSDVVDAAVGLQLAKAQLDRALGLNP